MELHLNNWCILPAPCPPPAFFMIFEAGSSAIAEYRFALYLSAFHGPICAGAICIKYPDSKRREPAITGPFHVDIQILTARSLSFFNSSLLCAYSPSVISTSVCPKISISSLTGMPSATQRLVNVDRNA